MLMNGKLIVIVIIILISACADNYSPAKKNYFYLDNCGVGCPVGGSSQTLFRDVYTLNNNKLTKFANWVAYKITKISQASGRPRNWRQDPDLPASDTLNPAAYNDANQSLSVDRGHQAPLAGLSRMAGWRALNYLSNITPQKATLNQGVWVRIEDKERELANREDIYVITGPLFEHHIATLPGAPTVEIPSGYWKIIFTRNASVIGKYAAFIIGQDVSRAANFCDYQVTVEEIEKRVRPKLIVWSELNSDFSRVVKKQKGTLIQDMGCSYFNNKLTNKYISE